MRRTDAKLDRVGKQLADLGLVQSLSFSLAKHAKNAKKLLFGDRSPETGFPTDTRSSQGMDSDRIDRMVVGSFGIDAYMRDKRLGRSPCPLCLCGEYQTFFAHFAYLRE
jgi:hypothetical protein